MKALLAVLGVLTATLLLAADAKEDPIKKESAKLSGNWQAASVVDDGKEATKDALEKIKLIVKGDAFLARFGDTLERGTHKIDPSKTPKTIDITTIDGVRKGKKQLGIYELTDDMYTACFAPPGKDRPTELTSEAGSGNVLIVWKRVKP